MRESLGEGVAISHKDLTKKSLIDNLKILNAVFSNMEDGIIFFDPKGHLLEWNSLAVRIFGFKDSSTVCKTLASFPSIFEMYTLDGKFIQFENWPMSKTLDGKVFSDYKFILYRRDTNMVCTLSANGTCIKDENNNVILAIITLRDITKQKLTEKRLRYQASIINRVSDAIIVTDKNFYIKTWSNAAEKIYGWKSEEVIGKSASEVFQAEIGRTLYYPKSVDLLDEGYCRADLIHYHRNGKPIYIESTFMAIYGKEGEIMGYTMVNRDITQRKKAEEELKEYRDHLERLVEERTTELSLINEELSRSNEELKQFAYVTSHDLQEPLRTIISFTQLLAQRYEGKLDSDADEFIDYVVKGTKRMQDMIQALLAYSRVGTKGKELEPVNVEKALKQTMYNLKVLIDENDAKITHDHLPEVMADEKQLMQLFQNLISNAIKFKREVPCIHISARRDGNEYIFSVTDNGIGMDPKFKDRIFLVFQRLHTRDKYPGTGIGLAICKKIIERHHGHIWVESELGKGSMFHFTLQPFFEKKEELFE